MYVISKKQKKPNLSVISGCEIVWAQDEETSVAFGHVFPSTLKIIELCKKEIIIVSEKNFL